MHKSQIEYQTYNVLSLLTSHADIRYIIEYRKSMVIQGSMDHDAYTRIGFVVFVFASNGKDYELQYCKSFFANCSISSPTDNSWLVGSAISVQMRRLLTRVSELYLGVEWSRHETNTIIQKEHRSEGTVNMFCPFVRMSIISRKNYLITG